MATAESVKAKLVGLLNQANTATGKADADLTAAVTSLVAGFGQGGGGGSSGGFELIEGTITPAVRSQYIRIPWEKETLPLFYVAMRQDFDTYVTPNNPATETVVGGVVQFACGYHRVNNSLSEHFLGVRITSSSGYTGYTASAVTGGIGGILNEDGLLADTRGGGLPWDTNTTYKYYIIDKVVQ